jgi:transposase
MSQRRRHSRDFKVEAVKLVVEQGYTVAEAAQSLGIHTNLLRNWKQKLLAEGDVVFRGNGVMTPEQQELRRLREENRKLRMERDILKKATAFFVKESS